MSTYGPVVCHTDAAVSSVRNGVGVGVVVEGHPDLNTSQLVMENCEYEHGKKVMYGECVAITRGITVARDQVLNSPDHIIIVRTDSRMAISLAEGGVTSRDPADEAQDEYRTKNQVKWRKWKQVKKQRKWQHYDGIPEVVEMRAAIEDLRSQDVTVILDWVPGHSVNPHNKKAHRLAVQGRNQVTKNR